MNGKTATHIWDGGFPKSAGVAETFWERGAARERTDIFAYLAKMEYNELCGSEVMETGERNGQYYRAGSAVLAGETSWSMGVCTYLTDGHGNVLHLTIKSTEKQNPFGATVNEHRHSDAFGSEIERYDFETNPFRYSGEYYDEETGMTYLRARYYDPSIGRFISEDTHWNTSNMIYGDNNTGVPSISAIMQSGNLYAYCSNDPMNRSDPSGNSWADFNYANGRWGFGTTMWLNSIANECLSAAENYAINTGLNSTWNNKADAYRHFLWNARLTREFGYYEARDITNVHEYNSISDNGWLAPGPFISLPNSSIVACKMNQESFMDLWNNQVGRELANNAAFKDMSYNQLFNMAIENNWLITDASNAFSFLGIESYITDYDSYTVDVYWDMNTGNIKLHGNGQIIELKIGV